MNVRPHWVNPLRQAYKFCWKPEECLLLQLQTDPKGFCPHIVVLCVHLMLDVMFLLSDLAHFHTELESPLVSFIYCFLMVLPLSHTLSPSPAVQRSRSLCWFRKKKLSLLGRQSLFLQHILHFLQKCSDISKLYILLQLRWPLQAPTVLAI